MSNFFDAESRDPSHSFISEEKVVKAILRQSESSAAYKAVLSECQEQTGLDQISLSWFVNRYPGFPVWLGIRRVLWQRDVFAGLLKKFTKTPCFNAWSEVADCKPEEDDRSVGCVFTWPQFGVCCIHQYRESSHASKDGIWISRKLPSFEEKFVIEPLYQLLKTIDWVLPEY